MMFSYVLITPARDEEAFIGRTLESVVSQTKLPVRWVIVDDGSVDRTSEIVSKFAQRYPWIQLVRRPRKSGRSFASKVEAFNAGYAALADVKYDVMGSLDADVSFGPDYLQFLLDCFASDHELGVAGTFFVEDGYDSSRDSFEGQAHVPGGCQLFRRECFEQIGGFVAHEDGGVDWIAVTTARMNGWKTRAFRQKSFFHHRRLGTAQRSTLAAMFRAGEKDYYLGKHPVSQLLRVLYRMTKKPILIGGLELFLGYSWALLLRKKRPITAELVRFRRREDKIKLSRLLNATLRRKPVDKFYLLDDREGAPPA
jgi:glycosyltransferase involved in cell wall biosynthesis